MNIDGSLLVFTSQDRKDEAIKQNWNIMLSVVKQNSIINLTSHLPSRTQNPAFSPSNKKIAYLSMSEPDVESDSYHIVIYDIEQKTHKSLTEFIDKSVEEFVWVSD